MEGDPVTIICGIRHFESPSARLLCAAVLTLFKLTKRTGKFTQLLSYNNVQDTEQQRSIWVHKDWDIQLKGFPGGYDMYECDAGGLIDANITVTIAEVKLEDAGMYKCAVHVNGDYGDGEHLRYRHSTTANLTVIYNPNRKANDNFPSWNSSRNTTKTRNTLILMSISCILLSLLFPLSP